ncbi:unnamed protein product [Victoria cruziana]
MQILASDCSCTLKNSWCDAARLPKTIKMMKSKLELDKLLSDHADRDTTAALSTEAFTCLLALSPVRLRSEEKESEDMSHPFAIDCSKCQILS